MSTAVHTDAAAYVAAIAELPLSSYRSSTQNGAIAVLASEVHIVRGAVAQGAAGLLLREPADGSEEVLRLLADAASAVPVVVERLLLRSDLVDDATPRDGAAPALVQVECSATSADLAVVARDSVGWARALAGGRLEYRSSRSTSRGFTLLLVLRSDDGVEVPVSVLATRKAAGSPWIRAMAIGAERTEVTIDVARRWSVVERTTEAGRAVLPTRWESAERVALRRAIDLLASGVTPTDLEDLAHDSALIARG